MMPRLTSDYAKNYFNRTLTVKVIVENVVTCFYGTRCIQQSPFVIVLEQRQTSATCICLDVSAPGQRLSGVFQSFAIASAY